MGLVLASHSNKTAFSQCFSCYYRLTCGKSLPLPSVCAHMCAHIYTGMDSTLHTYMLARVWMCANTEYNINKIRRIYAWHRTIDWWYFDIHINVHGLWIIIIMIYHILLRIDCKKYNIWTRTCTRQLIWWVAFVLMLRVIVGNPMEWRWYWLAALDRINLRPYVHFRRHWQSRRKRNVYIIDLLFGHDIAAVHCWNKW